MALHSPRLFDHDEDNGITEYFYYDDDTGGFVIETVEDVTEIIELNTIEANMAPDHWRGTNFHHVARIPPIEWMKMQQLGIATAGGRVLDPTAFKAWLNDRDNQKFRTKRGRV